MPEQKGLICQGWNWTLDEIKAEGKETDVGAMYITDDGNTRLYIRIPDGEQIEMTLNFNQGASEGVTIDWGDGEAVDTVAGSGNVTASHIYALAGEYVIVLTPVLGSLMLGHDTVSGEGVLGTTRGPAGCLVKVELGRNVYKLATRSFQPGFSLQTITITQNITQIGSYVFSQCVGLKAFVFPRAMAYLDSDGYFSGCTNIEHVIFSGAVKRLTSSGPVGSTFYLRSISIPKNASFSGNTFNYCQGLVRVSLPKGMTKIEAYCFGYCESLRRIDIPGSVVSIDQQGFYNSTWLAVIDFSKNESVPTLAATSAFYQVPTDCEIRVPAALYDEWIAATNWSTYADQIVAV